jgi:alanine racemase
MGKITQKISLSRPSWLEINLKNLDYNVGVIRKIIKIE